MDSGFGDFGGFGGSGVSLWVVGDGKWFVGYFVQHLTQSRALGEK